MNKGICPLCGKSNNCAYAAGKIHEGCWCEEVTVPKELIDRIPEYLKGKACICRECINKFNKKL